MTFNEYHITYMTNINDNETTIRHCLINSEKHLFDEDIVEYVSKNEQNDNVEIIKVNKRVNGVTHSFYKGI